jgi:hypothetical protein
MADDTAGALIRYLSLVLEKARLEKGGPGSGHWGHAGRPGSRGGSAAAATAMSVRTGATAKERQKLKKLASARGAKSASYEKTPQSTGTIPTAYEIGRKGVYASWKYPMSLRDEDGLSVIMRGKNGKYYAYRRNYTFEVEPAEKGEDDTIVVYKQ